MTLTAETASRFTIGSSPVISESTRPIFAKFSELVSLWAQMVAAKLSCDRSRDIAMANNFCAFNHDALGRRKRNTRGRPSTISVDNTSTPRKGHWPPGKRHLLPEHFPSDISLTLECDGIRQEVQVLRWTQANQLTDQSTIINRKRSGWQHVFYVCKL